MFEYKIKDITLADSGETHIRTAIEQMPVLAWVDQNFSGRKFLKGKRIVVSSHATKESAALCIVLKHCGAEVLLCSQKFASTQDDVAAALVKYWEIPVFASSNFKEEEREFFVDKVVEFAPDIIIDDGAVLLSPLYERHADFVSRIIGAIEQTASGVHKERVMEREGILRHPLIAADSCEIKHLFDNTYGVGQTGIMVLLRNNNILIALETVVIMGYGPLGKGLAKIMRNFGTHVIICETDPVRALDAYTAGYNVRSLKTALSEGTVFVTATGSCDVLPIDAIRQMKNGAILINLGSEQIEIDVASIKRTAKCEKINRYMDRYTFPDGKYVNLVTDGLPANLVHSEGNPPQVMDLTFSAIALSVEYLLCNHLERKIYVLPREVDQQIAAVKLSALGVPLIKPTQRQQDYDNDWRK